MSDTTERVVAFLISCCIGAAILAAVLWLIRGILEVLSW